ncbi:hypothetical protein [Methanoculleus taiwanensis]|uniref:hypothetical protein n=1 Tax=Methanoculleus taiwanensis TaxID=1550565 RepID=UPI003743286E
MEEFAAGLTYGKFCRDDKSAVTRRFTIIGEAARRTAMHSPTTYDTVISQSIRDVTNGS